MCLQVWSLLNLSSNIWSSPRMDSLLWTWQKRLQCWRPAPWNGSYPQADWIYHHEGQEHCHWIHQEVPPRTSLGSNDCCRCWTQSRIRGERNDLDNPEEVVVTRSRFAGFQHIILFVLNPFSSPSICSSEAENWGTVAPSEMIWHHSIWDNPVHDL